MVLALFASELSKNTSFFTLHPFPKDLSSLDYFGLYLVCALNVVISQKQDLIHKGNSFAF